MRRHFKYYRTWPIRLDRFFQRWDRMAIFHFPFMEYVAAFLLFGLFLLALLLVLWWAYPILHWLMERTR